VAKRESQWDGHEDPVSYQQVVDTARREAAERLLSDASLAVGQIGYLLGFSEPSAFHPHSDAGTASRPRKSAPTRRIGRPHHDGGWHATTPVPAPACRT
jgi:AraC-like DNA-binding protein